MVLQHQSAFKLFVGLLLFAMRACAFVLKKQTSIRAPLLRASATSWPSHGSARNHMSGPPIEPRGFGIDFKIEPYPSKLDLESFNAHPLDTSLVFDQVHHSYYFNGVKMENSVTTIIDKYFKKFDPLAVAEMMTKGSNWPREGYLKRDGTPFTIDEIVRKWYLEPPVCSNSLIDS